VDRHVDAVVKDAGFDAPDIRRPGGRDTERLARIHHAVPQLLAVRRIEQVELVAELAGPAGASDDQRNTVEAGLEESVVAEPGDLVAEQRMRDLPRFRPLQLQ